MSEQASYDAVVVGLGAMGSATLYQLAKRGLRVCGIERHHVAHDLGSSHGNVRMIRKAYFEHPDYVPLLDGSYAGWETLEEECGETLLKKCGLLLCGTPESKAIRGLEACYREHDLPHDRLSRAETLKRYPQFRLPESYVSFFDPEGGYLFIERCIEQFLEQAEQRGAEVQIHSEATAWHADDEGVTVTTGKGEVRAGALVLTLGPWAGEILGELNVPLTVKRTPQFWFDSPNIGRFSEPEFPAFYVEHAGGDFYGFPSIDGAGVKVAKHTDGDVVGDADEVSRSLHAEDEAEVMAFLSDTFPDLAPKFRHHSVCMYTMTPDENFILDVHPNHSNVVFGAGFSGHGFKFAPVVGEALADLATKGETSLPIGFLGLERLLA